MMWHWKSLKNGQVVEFGFGFLFRCRSSLVPTGNHRRAPHSRMPSFYICLCSCLCLLLVYRGVLPVLV
jgi:hypothetical protein